MGRHYKQILTEDGIDRRSTGYYSTPKFIADFISHELLSINPNGKYALDPAIGCEELVDVFYESGKQIDGIDIKDYGIHHKAKFIHKDFLEFYHEHIKSTVFEKSLNRYDYYVANPPYNCHEDDYIRQNKKHLLSLFSDIGVSNMYSMFIYALIDLAKEGALIGLITYDSFLTSYIHSNLRKKILSECSIHRIILCPTSLFRNQKADVRTCIIILQKGLQFQESILTLNRVTSNADFLEKLSQRAFIQQNLENTVLSGKNDLNEFIINVPPEILQLFHFPRIGKIFNCVTGISTGNDSKYISSTQNNYFTVPFFKNPGTRRFFTTPDGFLPSDFLEISERVPNFIVRNKSILFKEGISCSSMGVTFSASYLPPNSTFGVNANIICDPKDIWWLLAYLNSSLVTFIVRGILLRSNMITSGYVSRIPVIELSEDVKSILSSVSKKAFEAKVENGQAGFYVKEIDSIIYQTLGFSQHIVRHIEEYCDDLLRKT